MVRIRIMKPVAGVIDGVTLSRLHPGVIYEVPQSLGDYLLTIGAAEEMFSRFPEVDETGSYPSSMLSGGVTVSRETAADKPPRRKRR